MSGWAQNQRSPFIDVKNLNNDEKPVRISDVKIEVKVVGSLAVTTVDMTFHNPNHRILEGELQFPLADGQNISRYALDINGKLREGVVVDKAKGQKAFESTIRRKIDPGLLEKTAGNNFRTRVYPLPADGTRRIVIAYEQELTPDNGSFRFFLPIEYRDVLDNFSLDLSVFASGQTPHIDQTPWGEFAFSKSGDGYAASYSAKDFPAKGQIVFSIPVRNDIQLYAEKGKISGQTVFYTQLFPEVAQSAKKLPKQIALYWDVSSSMSNRNFKLESELLDAYFKRIGDFSINLYTFNCVEAKAQSFDIKNGDWSKLEETLATMSYDGATQLGNLNFAKVKADEILLFTDGLNNFGKVVPVPGTIPVTTVNSSLSADYNMLCHISTVTGGIFINLMQQNTKDAIDNLTNEKLRLIAADYKKSEILKLTTSGAIIDLKKGFSMAGRLIGDKATITLRFGTGADVLYEKTLTIDAKDAVDYGNIVERVWAAKYISELDMMYEQNKGEIEKTGRDYNIVTRNTSLIVLDDVRDYVEHGITPPEELLEEYNRQVQWKKDQRQKTNEYRLNHVLNQFEGRKKWWDPDYVTSEEKEKKVVQVSRTSRTSSAPDRLITGGRGSILIQGVIRDAANNDPLPGATVVVKSKPGFGAATNVNGQYSMKANPGDVLVFTYIGFEQQEKEVTESRTLDIGMKAAENTMLDEVVVTGLGPQKRLIITGLGPQKKVTETDGDNGDTLEEVVVTGTGRQKKVTLTGAIITVNVNELKVPATDLSNALAGRVSSVIVAEDSDLESLDLFISASEIDGEESNIKVKTWEPDASYMEILRSVANKELYTTYLELKEQYKMAPSFYLEVSKLFEERGLKDQAFIILSNLAELKMEDYRVLRVLAYRLKQLGYSEYAIIMLKDVLRLRPEEPQSYRDLGLAYADNGQYQEAVDIMYKILEQEWDRRFRTIELFAIDEINNTIAKAKFKGVKLDLSKIDQRIISNMPVDIRIVLNWDTDNSDMDLWVTDPNGEKCFYKNQRTKLGGLISDDLTEGYGPEVFQLKKAAKGKYIIQANYFGTREQTLIGTTTAYLDIYKYYGTKNETKETIIVQLTEDEATVDIGEVVF
jgi:tetratricopeptide (TPR) repeat protein